MATINPFDLLGGDDCDDPSEFIAAAEQKVAEKPKKVAPVAPAQTQSAKLPTKPPPPSQAVRELRNDSGRDSGGRGRGGGRGAGRGRGSFPREFSGSEVISGSNNGYSGGYKPTEDGDGKTSERRSYGDRPRGGGSSGGAVSGFRGGRRGGFNNGDAGEGDRSRRVFERRSGTGRGNEIKRDGAGRGNWGTAADEILQETEEPIVETEKEAGSDKLPIEDDGSNAVKETPAEEKEPEADPEPEDKEMTLEEYEKVLEEKRKALLALKSEERKVELDKDFKSMQALSNKKKSNDDIFIKLGSEKDKRKDAADKEDKTKKSVSINEFLKPAEGEKYHGPGGRGRGRGRGSRGGFGGYARDAAAPKIEDPGQFPSLGGK